MPKSKIEMYSLLCEGKLGNTIKQFFSFGEWNNHEDSKRYQYWGVRHSRVANHPGCRLYVKSEDVDDACRKLDGQVNISMMVDAIGGVLAWLEIAELPQLHVQGILHPPIDKGWNWRNSMKDPNRLKSWSGLSAAILLSHYLSPDSYDDLRILQAEYPGEVVELTVMDCDLNRNGRNAIIWEVRSY